jgi:hypothetical protein
MVKPSHSIELLTGITSKSSLQEMAWAIYMLLRAKSVRSCATIQAKTAIIHLFRSDETGQVTDGITAWKKFPSDILFTAF